MEKHVRHFEKNLKRILQVWFSFLWRFIILSFLANIIVGFAYKFIFSADHSKGNLLLTTVVCFLVVTLTLIAGLLAMGGALKSIYSDFKIVFEPTKSQDYEVSLIDRIETGT